MTSEADFYREELAKAREGMVVWEKLGIEFKKLDDPDWKLIRDIREAQISYFETMVRRHTQ